MSSSGLLLVDFFFLAVSFFGLVPPLPPDLSLSSSFFLEDDAASLVVCFSPSLTDFDGPATLSILTGI